VVLWLACFKCWFRTAVASHFVYSLRIQIMISFPVPQVLLKLVVQSIGASPTTLKYTNQCITIILYWCACMCTTQLAQCKRHTQAPRPSFKILLHQAMDGVPRHRLAIIHSHKPGARNCSDQTTKAPLVRALLRHGPAVSAALRALRQAVVTRHSCVHVAAPFSRLGSGLPDSPLARIPPEEPQRLIMFIDGHVMREV